MLQTVKSVPVHYDLVNYDVPMHYDLIKIQKETSDNLDWEFLTRPHKNTFFKYSDNCAPI